MGEKEINYVKSLAEQLFDCGIQSLHNETGEQGKSGARVHYFHFDSGEGRKKFVAKNATQLERKILVLLQEQKQAVPKLVSNGSKSGRDWVVMEFTEEISGSDNEAPEWAEKLGSALAKIHAANLGNQHSWLPALDVMNPLSSVFATEWSAQYQELVKTNKQFHEQFGKYEEKLLSSYSEFKAAVHEELSANQSLTLISTDLVPSHWRQKDAQPKLIDWEQARYSTLYFDLPNMFNDKTVAYYYRELAKQGVDIPADEFSKKFALLSRYLGFRYMTVGLSFWSDTPDREDGYWRKSGEKFFYKCLDVAQTGYPEPEL